MTRWHRIIRAALVAPVAVVVLAACTPKPAPPPPPTVNCDGLAGTYSQVLEACHNRYRTYQLDTTNVSAGNKALTLANSLASCSALSNSSHTPGPTLLAQYPGSTSVGENLYCWSGGPGVCPPFTNAASTAMNAWIRSAGHKANLDGFAGAWVNAAATCNQAKGMYIAVGQFHRP